jgi:putative exosortase-associated protein (TIGR04073 family)
MKFLGIFLAKSIELWLTNSEFMKNRILFMLVGALTAGSLAYGDIQSPPAGQWNWSRKLSRSLANLVYGGTEYNTTWKKVDEADGNNAAAAAFVVDGTKRTVVRLGYGLYELVTFPFPSYKGGYRPPYGALHKHENMDVWHGYQEFPPVVGFISQGHYNRGQSW